RMRPSGGGVKGEKGPERFARMPKFRPPPVAGARVLVARVGAEVGAVAHDVGFAVLDVAVDHGLIAAALDYVHAGFDGIGLFELSEVFEAGDDEDAVGAF